MPARTESSSVRWQEAALRHERDFVLAIGGYAVEIPGGHLVVHERIPAPRLNFVHVVGIPPARQAAFFERALDHYFQRALRPTFRVLNPVAPHLDQGLRGLGFRPRRAHHQLLVAPPRSEPPVSPFTIRPARAEELDLVVDFWGAAGTRLEFRRAVEVLWNFPHVGESVEPILVLQRDGPPVSAALVYRHHGMSGIHAVATQPAGRGSGAASALVAAALSEPLARASPVVCLPVDDPRAQERLRTLGFVAAAELTEYELPPDAQLAVPHLGPPGPPRWRPPRGPPAGA